MQTLQITSAEPGWYAVIEEEGHETFYLRVAAWALVEDEHGSWVQGVCPEQPEWFGAAENEGTRYEFRPFHPETHMDIDFA